MARVPKSQGFPIVEAFGYAFDAQTPASLAAKKNRWCPFMDKACEKFVQYGYGYCSVIYSAQDDRGIPQIYAVCDHRVDGIPLRTVLMDHFGDDMDGVQLVPEVVISDPRTSFDYVAITLSAERAPTCPPP